MRTGLSLLAYGLLLALIGPRLFAGRDGTRRAPRLGVLAWLVATVSVVLALVAGGLSLALPAVPAGEVNGLFAACADSFRAVTDAPDQALTRGLGGALATAVLVRAIWCMATGLRCAHRQRRRHAEALRIVARPVPHLDAVVLDVDSPLVYCLPGRTRQIVLTRGALNALSRAELRAVLAHERAHLTGRHHLALAAVRGLARAFPRVPLFAGAALEVPMLLEMCADDAAAARHGRRSVVRALRTLSAAATPVATLAAAATATVERLDRLSRPLRRQLATRVRLAVGVLALVAGPLIAATAPSAAALAHHLVFCPDLLG